MAVAQGMDEHTLPSDWTQENLRAKGSTKDKVVARAGDKVGREGASHMKDRQEAWGTCVLSSLRVSSQGQHGSCSAISKDAQKFQEVLDWEIILILARQSPPSCFNTITGIILKGPDSQTPGT